MKSPFYFCSRMKLLHKFFIILIITGAQEFVNAQLNEVQKELKRFAVSDIDTIEGWSDEGKLTLAVSQAVYKNWMAGESSNITVQLGVFKRYNYKKSNYIWDNMVISNYGLTRLQGAEIRKTDDRFELNSIFGGRIPKYWTYSFFVNLKSQFTNTYSDETDLQRDFRTSGFMAPAYLAAGPGIMWRKNDSFFFNMAPVSTKAVFLTGEVFVYDKNTDSFVSSRDKTVFGVDAGKSSRYKLGFYLMGYLKFRLLENVHLENILSVYANYLDNPENIDIDYTMNMTMKINKILSTQLLFQTRYDDDAFPGMQFRESVGLGFNFKI